MASRLDFSQIRSLYIGTSSSTTVDTNNLIVVGSVGIGTTAPGSKLQVEGANPFIRVNNTSADDHGIKISYNGSDAHGLHLLYNANSAVSYIDNTYQAVSGQVYGNIYIRQNVGGTMTPRITIKADGGNVGIGTTSPKQKLDVAGAGGKIAITNTGTTNYSELMFYEGASIKADIWVNGSAQTDYAGANSMNIWQGSNAPIVFYTNGTNERMRITGAGNVGIGTSAPDTPLSSARGIVINSGASNDVQIRMQNNTTGSAGSDGGLLSISGSQMYLWNYEASNLIFGTSNSERMRIDSSGNLGVGTTSPSEKLHVVGVGRFDGVNVNVRAIDGTIITKVQSQTAGATQGAIGTESNNDLAILTNNTSRMLVTAAGNVGIGTTTPSYKLDVVGDARITSGSLGVGVAPNATDGRIDASNDIVAYSTSDQRLKENVTPIENALEKVKTLTGVEFDWKEETAHVHGYHGHDVGIIAQDVQAVLPEAVRTNESGYLSVRYEKMIALLIEGMKEQQKQIDELKKLIK